MWCSFLYRGMEWNDGLWGFENEFVDLTHSFEMKSHLKFAAAAQQTKPHGVKIYLVSFSHFVFFSS